MTNKIDMQQVMRALESVRGAPVLTSNQCADLAKELNDAAPLSPDHSGGGAGMVLPERKEALNVIGSAYDDGICEGWNACLDKVKELNQ